MPERTKEDPFQNESPNRRTRRSVEREPVETYRPGRRRWPWVLLALLVIVLLLPNIIGWLGLQKHILPYAVKDFNGSVNVQSASMGWFQPIKLSGVEVKDRAGNPILNAASIETSRPMHAFVTSSDYGEITVNQPFVMVDLVDGGSNIEDAIANYIEAAKPSPLDPPPTASETSAFELPSLIVKINDGSAIIRSNQTVPAGVPQQSESWQIDSLSGVMSLASDQAPLAATIQCRASKLGVDASGQTVLSESGTLLLKSAFDAGQEKLEFSTANVELETSQVPLSIIAPLAHRAIGPAQTAGAATMKLGAAYNIAFGDVVANIENLELTSASIIAPETLGSDQLFIDRVFAVGNIEASPTRIVANNFNVETDFGQLSANGQFDPTQLAKIGEGTQLLNDPLQVQGEFDVAKLLQRLPDTLNLHEDLKVDSGTVRLNAGTHNENGIRRLVVNMDTANIRGSRAGKPIVWQQPLRIVGVVREADGQFSLENFECKSDFLAIQGSATAKEAIFTTSGDLGQLTQRIGQFADLGDNQFGGKLNGRFGWAIEGASGVTLAELSGRPVQIYGEFNVAQPQIQLTGMPLWQPEKVDLRFSAGGKLNSDDENMSLPIGQAGAQLNIGAETAVVSLAQPVTDAFTNQQWIFNSQVVGKIDGWLAHVRNFVDPGDFTASGNINFAGVTVANPQQIVIQNGQYEIQGLGFDGYGAKIQEDRVVGGINLEYALETGDIRVQQGSLQGTSLSATAQDLKIGYGADGGMTIDGTAAWHADVNRLAEWFSLSTEADSIYWYGATEGNVQFNSTPQGTRGVIRSGMKNVVATQRATLPAQRTPVQLVGNVERAWVELWKEPQVDVSGQFDLSPDFNSLALQQLSVRSDSLELETRGNVGELMSGYPVVDLEGNWRPSFDKVNSLLGSYTSNLVSLRGNASKPFRIKGPVIPGESDTWLPAQLQLQTQLSWDAANLAGFPVGQSDIAINLNQQIANVDTSGIQISGGMVQLKPQIDLRGSEPVLIHSEAQLMNQVELTPEICREFVSLVAPWMGDTTQVQGKISANLQGMNVPLFDPTNLSAQGTMELQDVVIAAGPMAEQLLGTVNQIQAILKPDSGDDLKNTWITVEQQSIPVSVENRRVYHDNIKFSRDDIVIQTSGSVGFVDQTLDLVAKIPIAEDWIKDKPYLASLRGQFLSIPIRGTATKPVIDQSAVKQLSANLVRNAATGAINNAVSEKLAPKLNQYQNELNSKVGGEVNKLQSKFQDKLGGFLQNKLGAPQTAPAAGGATQAQPSIENRLNGELQKGLNSLFGK